MYCSVVAGQFKLVIAYLELEYDRLGGCWRGIRVFPFITYPKVSLVLITNRSLIQVLILLLSWYHSPDGICWDISAFEVPKLEAFSWLQSANNCFTRSICTSGAVLRDIICSTTLKTPFCTVCKFIISRVKRLNAINRSVEPSRCLGRSGTSRSGIPAVANFFLMPSTFQALSVSLIWVITLADKMGRLRDILLLFHNSEESLNWRTKSCPERLCVTAIEENTDWPQIGLIYPDMSESIIL